MKKLVSLALMLMVSINASIHLTAQVTGSGTANNVAKWSSSSSITNSQIYDNGTNVGIGTTSPSALFQVQNGSILFNGTTGSVPISNTAGVRFMWVPDKAALRFGELTIWNSGMWDSANIGYASFAGGHDSWATGDYSFAFGYDARVDQGTSCISMGWGAYTMGNSSAAIGLGSYSAGDGSMALGWGASAIGIGAVALGTNVTATPNYGNSGSIAIGYESRTFCDSCIIIGTNNFAFGNRSLALGNEAYAIYSNSIAIGTQSVTRADGDYSIAIGDGAVNDGYARSIIFNDDDNNETDKLRNKASNQFMARYRGGFVLYSHQTASDENSFQLNNGAVGIGTADFQEKLNLDGNFAIKSKMQPVQDRLIYIDSLPVVDSGAIGNNLKIYGGGLSRDSYSPVGDVTGGNLELYGGNALDIGASSTFASGGNVVIRGGEGYNVASPSNVKRGDVNIGGALTEYLNVNSRIGIGTAGSASYLLLLSVDQAAKPSTNTWTISSDARLKKDIQPFTDGLAIVNGIKPVTYWYNGLAGMPTDKENIGIVAQEIKTVAPYTVGTFKAKLNPDDNEETELLDFNSHALTFVLINAVKELDERTKDLKTSTLSKSDNTNPDLNSRIENIENQLQKLSIAIDGICNLPCMQGPQGNVSPSDVTNTTSQQAYLMQNIPNPNNGQTVIPYFLPETAINAEIKITDATGKIISSYTLQQKGKSQLAINLVLNQGIYYYSLFIDGKLIETKSMTIINH